MKVKGFVTVCFVEGTLCNYVELTVKFKLPGQILYRRKSDWLASDFHDSEDEFFEKATRRLSDKYFLQEKGKEMIIDCLKEKFKQTDKDVNKAKIAELIKAVNENKIEVEVEYNK